MRGFARRPGGLRPGLWAKPTTWVLAVIATAATGIAATSPTAAGAERLAVRLAAAATSLPRRAPFVPPALLHGISYSGTPAVGALIVSTGGQLGQHFCTASVVTSPARDLVITAAHCLAGRPPSSVAFVPELDDGRMPYGSWAITHIYVDGAWASSANPNDDVAFFTVTQPGNPYPIQDLTGGERLGTGPGPVQPVQVIGYPDATQQPITCTSRTRGFGADQMEFDCGGYTNGTSGGPFLAGVSGGTGLGTVIGVIGGYQEGGDTPAVSYSARFGSAVRALYDQATSQG